MSKVRAAIELPEGKSIEDVQEDLRRAATEKSGDNTWSYVEHTTDGTVVVCIEGEGEGEMLRFGWEIDGEGTAVLTGKGEPVEKVVTYEAVSATFTGKIVAAVTPSKFKVRVIGVGFGENSEAGRKWFVPDTDEGIGSARKTFGGAMVHWDFDPATGTFGHAADDTPFWLRGREAGYLSDLSLAPDGLEAMLHVHDDTPQTIRDLIESGEIGLSIEAFAERRPGIRDGVAVVDLVNFRHGERPASVALVTNPALQGRILSVAAAVLKELSVSTDTKTAAEKIAAETKTASDALAASVTKADELTTALQAQLTAATVATGRATLENTITASKLPEKGAALVRKHFEATFVAGAVPEAEAVDAQVTAVRELIADASALNAAGAVSIGTEPQDRVSLRLENLFVRNAPAYVRAAVEAENDGKSIDQRLIAAGMPRGGEPSVLRLFRDCTGHDFHDLRGPRSKAVKASILSTTWGDAWENVLNRVFLTAYDENPDFGDWRKVAKVVPVSNFVKQERMVKGGYANLSTVSEGANYTSFTSPGDEGHGYTPAKRGNTEDVTWEAFLRDDVGALTDLPVRMGTAAARTLYEFVFDLYSIAGAPTMDYDTTNLYHADHSNAGTTALAAAEVIVAIKAMMNQTDLTTSKKLMVMPKFMLVPVALWNTAFDILKSPSAAPGGSTVDNVWTHQFMLEAIVVRHWTNTTDWFLAADPHTFPTAEIGFVNGQETPELFVQDDVSFGSMFEADKRTYKIRHPYGGTILRHEGVYSENVA